MKEPPKLIVLDRDGVINVDSDAFIKSVDEWQPIPGSFDAIARFNRAGYRVVVATNQSGVSRGLFDLEMLGKMHNRMHTLAAEVGGHIEAVFFCPHGPESQCDCRKPKPGLLHQIANRFNIQLENTPCVGDSLRDLQAAATVGAKPILVKTGKGEKTLEAHADELPTGTLVFDSLFAVAEYLVPDDPHGEQPKRFTTP